MKIKRKYLIIIGCFSLALLCNLGYAKDSGYKNYKGIQIPIEWTDREPLSKEDSLKIKEGDSFDKAIKLLGIPFQDSGKDKYIWHYRLDDNTYLQLIGTTKIEKILRYTLEDIK